MPDMNGLELRECLQAEFPGIRVVYMSEYSCPEMARLGITGVPADFLQKPFSKEVLAAKVREVLDGGLSIAD